MKIFAFRLYLPSYDENNKRNTNVFAIAYQKFFSIPKSITKPILMKSKPTLKATGYQIGFIRRPGAPAHPKVSVNIFLRVCITLDAGVGDAFQR